MKSSKSRTVQPYWRGHLHWMLLLTVGYTMVYTAIRDNKLWLWYGVAYTLIVLIMGARVIIKRKNRYVRVRTASLMFFQFFLFFLLHRFILPKELGKAAGYPWPLNITSLYPWRPDWVLAYALIFTFVFIPFVTYFWGRRVYCSWICSCGAISETLGDPFRPRAPKGKTANTLEIGMYIVFFIATIVTISVWMGKGQPHTWYNLIIMFYISGIIVMAAYPFMGGRIWCRYFCPAAAWIGAISKRGRFAVVGDQKKCIKCGICTDNCQMGIDVRGFISQGEKIKTDECVGCGICISLCPVKTLRFEGGLDFSKLKRKIFKK